MELYQRNRLEKAVQDVTDSSKGWLEEEFRSILESNKPYQSKCDYIGYSLASIDEKIKLVESEMKELKFYKDRLKQAKALATEIGAKVFDSYGITKIEGGGISSITVSKAIKSTKLDIVEIHDEESLIQQGFYKKVIDKQKILASYADDEYRDLIDMSASIANIETVTPSKLKVNKRRAVNHLDLNLTKDAA